MKLKNFAWLLAAALVAGCSSDDDAAESKAADDGNDARTAPLQLTEEQQAMVEPLNDFSVKLFQQLSTTSGSHSAVVSPLSTAFVMGMLNEGAEGQTSDELTAALGLQGKGREAVSQLFTQYIQALPSADKDVAVAIANNASVNERCQLRESYQTAVERRYDASVLSLDFTTPAATKAVNSWCSQHTRGLIPSITDGLNSSDVLCLLSAVYFKGRWADKFGETSSMYFSTPAERLLLKMMGRTGSMQYCEQQGLQAVRLPLGGGTYAMTVVLPPAGQQFPDFVRSLTARQLSDLAFSERQVEASIPIFTTTADIDLSVLLKGMGVERLFTTDAQLTGIAYSAPLYVTLMQQKTRLGIDEEGCEGAAVSLAELSQGSDFSDKPKALQFLCTRPFVYYVSEVQSGTILFMGQFCGD